MGVLFFCISGNFFEITMHIYNRITDILSLAILSAVLTGDFIAAIPGRELIAMYSEYDTFFKEIYEKTNKKILSYIIARCGKMEDVEDIFQETYLEFVKVLKRKGISYFQNPEAFLMQLAKKQIYRHYRLREKLGIFENIDEIEESSLAGTDSLYLPEDLLISKDFIERAKGLIDEKDIITRKIVYLHYYAGETLMEIADLLGVNLSTVKSRLYRLLKELNEKLGGEHHG